jgi:hypothetical protein
VQTTLGQSFHHEETKSTKKAACLGFLSFLRVLRFFVVCAIPVCPDLVIVLLFVVQVPNLHQPRERLF